MIGKDKIFSTLNKVIKKSPAEQTEAVFIGNSFGLSRFTNSHIHQNVFESTNKLYFRVAVGKRIGVVSTTSMEKEDLNRALLNAYNIALNQRDNPDFTELPGKAEYRKIKTYYPSTAAYTPMERAKKIKAIFRIAGKHNLNAAGSFSTSETEVAVVNSNGVKAYQPLTSAAINLIVLGDNSSGYAEGLSRDVRKLNFKEITERATQKCLDSVNPMEIPPGKYDVILEPKAVAEIIEWLNYTGFNPKSLDDGSSFLAGHLGKKIMGENVSLYDDAIDDNGIPFPFDFEGVPKRKVYFVKKGIGVGVVHNSLTAHHAGTKSTGHSLTPDASDNAYSFNTFMAAGRNSLNSMISKTEKGILVTRFHYINGFIDTNKAVMTGMTKDGTFLIKNGKINQSIKNLRFTESMVKAFSRVKMISRERQAIDAWWSDIGCIVAPTLLISNFNFSGKTQF